MSEHWHLLSRFKQKVGLTSQPPSLMGYPGFSTNHLFDDMLVDEESHAVPESKKRYDDGADTKLRKIINYINGYHASEKRIIDLMIQESAVRCLKSHADKCPRCGSGWMQPVGFVMCGPMKSRDLVVSEMYSDPTLRCDQVECQFELQQPEAIVGGRA